MSSTPISSVALGPSGIVLDGHEEVMLCASLFYFRIPRELWRSRLEQVRSSGYRVIDVYLPWNFHELAPGEWDFSGRRDVGTFLDLAHELGLLVVARPGPYICSEWDGGSLPAWLGLDPELGVRQYEERYLAAVQRWFERAFGVLVPRQYGSGGSVVAVQLENELDFFDTHDRAGYVGRLRDLARCAGVRVPLIACAGQGDMVGATGGVSDVVPAFNFYPDDSSLWTEPEVRRYSALMADRDEPLLVTETNRRHLTLRRLLVSGAQLIAPYLQASGYNMGYTPSVGNWGDPAGLMTHDYDFGGFLSPTGEEREEMVQARVLSAVVTVLGGALAGARPVPAEAAYRTASPTSASPSRMLLDGGGSLLGVTNLGEKAGEVTIHGAVPVRVPLPAQTCLLVVQDLPLDRWGLDGTIRTASADLVGLDESGITLSAGSGSVIVLESATGERAETRLAAPVAGAVLETVVRAGDAEWTVRVIHPADVAPRGLAELGREHGQVGSDATCRDAAQSVAQWSAAPGLRVCEVEELAPEPLQMTSAPWSESVGVYRGRTHYEASVEGVRALLVEGASDIVDLTLDDVALPTLTPYGASTIVGVASASRLGATVETWGHSNFDDTRLPALRIGSLRGIGRVWSVVEVTDVGALWYVDGDDGYGTGQWAGEPAPIRGLGGWSSTRLGRSVTYRRSLDLDPTEHYALHLLGVRGSARVHHAGGSQTVSQQNPWVHIEPNSGGDVAVTIPHAPGTLSGAELLRLEAVEDWSVRPEPDRAIVARVLGATPVAPVNLPLRLLPGQEEVLDLELPPGGWSLRLDGDAVRVSVFGHGELLGRVWAGSEGVPRLTGGDPDRVWVPAAWNDGSVRLLVRGAAGGRTPTLTTIIATTSRE